MARQQNGMVFISRLRTLLAAAMLLCALAPIASADTITTGVDTFVESVAPDAFHGTEIVLEWNGGVPGVGQQPSQGLLKYNLNLDAPDPNGTLRQRILATPYFRARIRVDVVNSGDDANLHRMLAAFDDNTTWNTLGGGVQTSGAGQNAEATSNASTSGAGSTGTIEIDVTDDLLAWANGATNHGWAFLPTGNEGVQLSSFEGGAGSPLLILDQAQSLVTAGAAGSTWRYYDGIPSGDPSYPTDAGGDPWYAADFDDGTWNSGSGQFGYGEGDETVVLDNGQGGGACKNKSPCRITYLFRTTFEVTEIPDELIVEIVSDDAVKLYLNDVEVLLENITNPVDATTLADSEIKGSEENVFLTFLLNPADLVAGTNTLAVEVHNDDVKSDDISFDLALIAIIDSLVAVPEPGTGALLGLGLAALAAVRRRSGGR
jgi:hypothetical protein